MAFIVNTKYVTCVAIVGCLSPEYLFVVVVAVMDMWIQTNCLGSESHISQSVERNFQTELPIVKNLKCLKFPQMGNSYTNRHDYLHLLSQQIHGDTSQDGTSFCPDLSVLYVLLKRRVLSVVTDVLSLWHKYNA